MADFIFNVAKGKFAEKYADAPTAGGMLILRTAGLESDAVLKDKVTIADLLSGTTDEVTNSGYARKTGLSITVTVDQASDFTTVSMANQTWNTVGAGDVWAKAITFIDEGGTDATRIPVSAHDIAAGQGTPSGGNMTGNWTGGGFARAF